MGLCSNSRAHAAGAAAEKAIGREAVYGTCRGQKYVCRSILFTTGFRPSHRRAQPASSAVNEPAGLVGSW